MSVPTSLPAQPSRREFLKSAGGVAAAVTIGFQWAGPPRRAAAAALAGAEPLFAPNAFLRIGRRQQRDDHCQAPGDGSGFLYRHRHGAR